MTHKSKSSSAKTAFFPGSFNPFTIGHKSIVERALTIFDTVVIGIGHNIAKEPTEEVDQRVKQIADIFRNNDSVNVISYSGLSVEAAKSVEADCMIRGVRSASDYEYELNLADANRDISGIETLLLPALPQYSFISSSMVRELQAFGSDVSKYLP